ncbi:MAG TPA: response regulator [Gemmatimonadaceae bacterium]
MISQPYPGSTATSSRAHVLLVEDEPTLARVFGLVLTGAGYSVTACADGAEALQSFRASPDRVQVIVSDVTMPRLSGDQLARAVHEIRPEVPIILMSGCSTLLADSVRTVGIAEILQKPVGIDDLVGAVESALERERLRTRAVR